MQPLRRGTSGSAVAEVRRMLASIGLLDNSAPETVDVFEEMLDVASIANAHLNSVEAFLEHEQLHERSRVQSVGSPCGPVMSFLPALTIPGLTPRMDPVPAVGQHNQAIFSELGLSKET